MKLETLIKKLEEIKAKLGGEVICTAFQHPEEEDIAPVSSLSMADGELHIS